MRYIIFTILFFIIAAVIKIDLQEGTLPLASFYEEEICEEQIEYEWQHIIVRVQQSDTMYSLFAASPTNAPLPERLAEFYKANPHLQQQSLVPGELIKLPIRKQKENKCR
ncbi:hypothetical protein P9B03_16060 [Metasolibacillus meyeri]|uniref:LysM domain-containing protein n=1 Tax=Metasolibacillus meyeri TaxID=1071052 RepID=A0AAW9NX78_9BACL|nr:hypothetical protein [Metasolibacillus meyeri]MEC1180016.1 hypothetical protein [Metasolibacillus meyeri]